MDIELRHLRYFIAVADAGSFTRAADRVHVAQQVLSRQISQLEAVVGAELFERNTRGVRLTVAGELFLGESRIALTTVENAIGLARSAVGRLSGQLRVGLHVAASGTEPSELLARLTDRHPRLDVILRTFELDQPAAGLLDGRSDIAFIRSPVTAPGIDSIQVVVEPRVFVLPAAHPLATRPMLTLRDVAGQPWVATAPARDGSPPMTWRDAWLLNPRADGEQPLVAAVAATLDEWREQVVAGKGISLCPASAEQYYPRPGIAFVQAGGVPDAEVRLAWREGDRRPTILALTELVNRSCVPVGIATARTTKDAMR